ncbi:hypothetical protein ACFQZ4_39970 [Catellatospora coxensis]
MTAPSSLWRRTVIAAAAPKQQRDRPGQGRQREQVGAGDPQAERDDAVPEHHRLLRERHPAERDRTRAARWPTATPPPTRCCSRGPRSRPKRCAT